MSWPSDRHGGRRGLSILYPCSPGGVRVFSKSEPRHDVDGDLDMALAALLLTHTCTGISNTLTLGKIGYMTMSIRREAAGLKTWTIRPCVNNIDMRDQLARQ